MTKVAAAFQPDGAMEDSKSKRPEPGCVQLDSAIIQRSSPVPLYFQLAAYMEEKISSKQWAPGQMLPSEEKFCRNLGVSRTVVRQAMASLEWAGRASGGAVAALGVAACSSITASREGITHQT